MDLAYIDQLSNNGNGFLHKSSVGPKIILTGAIITSVIISNNLLEMVIFLMLLILLNILNKMPLEKVIHLALYPAFFSLMFALIRFTYSVEAGLIIILKAVDSALAMILLITTTPYGEVFSFLRLFLPGVVVDGMFFTYRIFFILIEKMGNALVVMKLRGNFTLKNLVFYLKYLAGVIGIIFINAFGISERMYNIYSLRGYEGKLYDGKDWLKLRKVDMFPLSLSLVITILVVIF